MSNTTPLSKDINDRADDKPNIQILDDTHTGNNCKKCGGINHEIIFVPIEEVN